MNHKLTWGTALMLALATVAAPALADDDRRGRNGYSHRDNDRNDRRHERRDDRRDDRRDYREARRDYREDRRDYRDDRRDHRRDRRDYRQDRRGYANASYYRPPVRVVHHRPVVRHYGPPRWARGGYVHHYQRPVYVVRDYRGYGLRHPPRGYHWVRDDIGDYLLVAIATGLIADLILRH